jgi:ketosteroid isomerase-like protein
MATEGRHAFTAGMAARDIDAVVDSLAPDVVLHSAVARSPFEGKDVVADVYRSVLEAFEELRIVDEFQSGDTHSFWWEGRMDGRFVAGADRVRSDAEGRAREITVVARPLSGLSTFVTAIGLRFGRRRRGPAVGRALRITALPLPVLFTLLEPITRWLSRGRAGR